MAAHSVELLFDPDTDAAIRRTWTMLAQAGLPSQALHRSPTNRPHVTVAVADQIDPAVDRHLLAAAAELPLTCRVGAPMVFGGPSFALVRLVVPDRELLRLHELVVAECEPFLLRAPYRHSLPGQWTPHVTLARRMTAADVGAALGLIEAADLQGTFTGMRRWDGDARVDTPVG